MLDPFPCLYVCLFGVLCFDFFFSYFEKALFSKKEKSMVAIQASSPTDLSFLHLFLGDPPKGKALCG